MSHSLKILGLAIVATAVATPALAAEAKYAPKTHTVVEQVGVIETVEYPIDVTQTFAKLDTDRNGLISFKEYRNGSQVDEPYGIFLRMDANQDEVVDIVELNSFSKTKGGSRSASRFNFNKPTDTRSVN